MAQELFEEMVSGFVWPGLKQLGFKRRRGNFHRPVGANWEVINLQRSYWSETGHVAFTVNLGVAWECVRETVRGSEWKAGTRPSVYDCHFHERLGFLFAGRDVWWDINAGTDVAVLAEAVAQAIERYGLPWLDERSDEFNFRDRSLADLSVRPNHDLLVLKRLVEQVGPPSALQALEKERNRRP